MQGAAAWPTTREPNPFIRYRTLLHSYARWCAQGGTDEGWCDRVSRFDDRVATLDGRGFRVTPLTSVADVTAKDETGNVAGSHKGRHLFGTLLALADDGAEELAIASCGNAALAAAVVARAADRRLRVFVPVWASADVVRRLDELGAKVEVCPRRAGDVGDPCVTAFRRAVAAGAVPFSCQGTDNGLALDGGRTLGWELADQLDGADHVVVQVGGGALASSTFHALADAVALGRWDATPRLHAVQAVGASPLVRAWSTISRAAAASGWTA
ncbi:MAG TPA: PLP-dependent lyase/thiolase, partial [Acidimicrobiia bacterium]|nr:PLP-dependent lyase/thiolase [Acidimicrobiia bacterium]